MRLIPLALGLLALTGCAQFQWQKYGATQDDWNRDTYSCQMEAARTYPTQLASYQVASGYQTPTNTNCSSSGSAYGSGGYNNSYVSGNSSTNCTTTGGNYVPPTTSTYDANQNNRNQAAKSCMYARGWQYVRVK